MRLRKIAFNLVLTTLTAALTTPAFASCTVEFPNTGFRCIESDEGRAESIGSGVFVGPQADLTLNLQILSISGLFGGCIIPLDRNGNEISECSVCDGTFQGNEITCETNTFPVDLFLGSS